MIPAHANMILLTKTQMLPKAQILLTKAMMKTKKHEEVDAKEVNDNNHNDTSANKEVEEDGDIATTNR